MSEEAGGALICLLLLASAVVGMLLPAPRKPLSTDDLLAEIARRLLRKL